MAHSERPERGGGQGHWRRRQHRWNGPNPFHNDNRGPVFQQYNGCAGPGAFRVGPRLPPVGRHDGNTGALDELTLKHMAQDCSSVKNKLLKLKSLLQMEEGGPEIVDDNEEENCMTLQLEELMKEVQRLREELRSKERTISQLTQQQLQLQQQVPAQAVQPGRCHCHQRAPSFRGDVRTHHDKATQTPCRGQGHSQPPQMLQPSCPRHHEHLTQERIVKTVLTEVHSDIQRRRPSGDGSTFTDSARPDDSPARGEDTPPGPNPDKLSVFFSTQLTTCDGEGPRTTPCLTQGFRVARSAAPGALSRTEGGQQTTQVGSCGPGCPRVLQPPCVHKRVSIPALPQEGPNGYVFHTGSAAQLVSNMTNQLPPPSRDLPCLESGPLALGLAQGQGLWTKPRMVRSPPYPSLEEQDMGRLRDERVLVPSLLLTAPQAKDPLKSSDN